MNFNVDDIIKLNNTEDYLVVDEFFINNTRFLYLTAMNKEENAFVKVVEQNGTTILTPLTQDELNAVINEFIAKYQNIIDDITKPQEN